MTRWLRGLRLIWNDFDLQVRTRNCSGWVWRSVQRGSKRLMRSLGKPWFASPFTRSLTVRRMQRMAMYLPSSAGLMWTTPRIIPTPTRCSVTHSCARNGNTLTNCLWRRPRASNGPTNCGRIRRNGSESSKSKTLKTNRRPGWKLRWARMCGICWSISGARLVPSKTDGSSYRTPGCLSTRRRHCARATVRWASRTFSRTICGRRAPFAHSVVLPSRRLDARWRLPPSISSCPLWLIAIYFFLYLIKLNF